MMRLRQPFRLPEGRRPRVLIQARFSTEEQRQSSIDDQVASCRRFLAENLPSGVGLDDVDIQVIGEPEISGERLRRPGIDQVWAGIDVRQWDVIIAEESSRLYRSMTFAGQFFNAAFDAGIRILCPTDMIDTADEDWPERLTMSQSQHSRANYFNRSRINRALTGLWERGAAIGLLRPGYRRRPSRPATATTPAEGPFFDEIDEDQAPIIREIYERVARGEPPWAVGDWLTSVGFRKAPNSQKAEWSAANVIALVRRPDYRGE
jgi:DNA invertase Pin-like site-specific DNA recombinase